MIYFHEHVVVISDLNFTSENLQHFAFLLPKEGVSMLNGPLCVKAYTSIHLPYRHDETTRRLVISSYCSEKRIITQRVIIIFQPVTIFVILLQLVIF